ATANNITLDGLSFGSGSVPQDALRTTRVVTSTYDVARGQFSGGLVASTTRSGTNVPQGSFTYALRDRDLAWGGVSASPFDQGYTQNQLGGGMGGPVVPNGCSHSARYKGAGADRHCHRSPRPMRRASSGSELARTRPRGFSRSR